jgi:hypothetical protein
MKESRKELSQQKENPGNEVENCSVCIGVLYAVFNFLSKVVLKDVGRIACKKNEKKMKSRSEPV